jgi:transcriptional regulator with XRE-family HTH domain
MQIQSLGAKVRMLREQLGLTLREFSRRTGISPSFLCEVESGRRNPGPERLEKISETLNVPLSDLVDLDHRITLAMLQEMLENDPSWGLVFRRIHAAAASQRLHPAALLKKIPSGC